MAWLVRPRGEQEQAPERRPGQLRADVRQGLASREVARDREGDRDRRVDVCAGEMPDCVHEPHDGQARHRCLCGQAEVGVAGRGLCRAPADEEDEHERRDQLGERATRQPRTVRQRRSPAERR